MENIFTSENGHLTIKINEDNKVINLDWMGKCTSLYPSQFLTPLFEELLAKNKKIIMNFSKLTYVTSSTLAPLIKLLDTVQHGTGELELLYDNNIDWQMMTFPSFVMFTECSRIKIREIP